MVLSPRTGEEGAVVACLVPLASLQGAAVTTVEGLGEDLHPVQDLLHVGHATQCGFCSPGFVSFLLYFVDMSLYSLHIKGDVCCWAPCELSKSRHRGSRPRFARQSLPMHRISSDPLFPLKPLFKDRKQTWLPRRLVPERGRGETKN